MILRTGRSNLLAFSVERIAHSLERRAFSKILSAIRYPCLPRFAWRRQALSAKKDFTPLESPVPLQRGFVTGPAIYGGDERYESLIPYRKGRVKAPSFLTGFTLLELLIVVFLIAVTLGLSLPLFRKTFTDIKLTSALGDMVNLMRYGQERAIVESAVFRLNVDETHGEYWLTKAKKEEAKTIVIFEQVPGRFGKRYRVPDELTLSSEENTIDFYPDGEMSRGKITLQNTDEKSSTIVVAPNAGNAISIIENAQQ